MADTFNAGIEAAARLIEKMRDDYDAEHGNTDPETGSREYPGNGEEYWQTLDELAESIRALVPASGEGKDAELSDGQIMELFHEHGPENGRWPFGWEIRFARALLDAARTRAPTGEQP